MNQLSEWIEKNRIYIIATIFTILIIGSHRHNYLIQWQEAGRFSTIQQIIYHHELSLPSDFPSTIHDKVYIGKSFYTDKPILPLIITAFILYPVKFFTSNTFVLYVLIKLVWNLLPLLCLVKVLNSPLFTFKEILLLIFSTTVTSYLSVLSPIFGCSLLIGAAYLSELQQQKKNAFFFLALSIILEPTAALIAIPFFLKNLRHSYWLIYILIPSVAHLASNYLIHQRLTFPNTHSEYFHYMGSPWIDQDLTGIALNKMDQVALNLFQFSIGPKSMLWLAPHLIWGFVAIPLEWLFGILMLTLYFLFFSTSNGGECFGVRWLLIFQFILNINYFYKIKLKHKLLIAISVFSTMIGILNPWISHTGFLPQNLTYLFYFLNLK